MTVDELIELIRQADWFARLGEPGAPRDCIAISSLSPWADLPGEVLAFDWIADEMTWLPSSKDQEDLVHGRVLEEQAEAKGLSQACLKESVSAYRTALASLRDVVEPCRLHAGTHNFTPAAHGAALFAVRRAAFEAVLDRPGFWCRMMSIYHGGHWPCGRLRDGRIVVF